MVPPGRPLGPRDLTLETRRHVAVAVQSLPSRKATFCRSTMINREMLSIEIRRRCTHDTNDGYQFRGRYAREEERQIRAVLVSWWNAPLAPVDPAMSRCGWTQPLSSYCWCFAQSC